MDKRYRHDVSDGLYVRDGQDAFANAIALGLKTPDEWMYMYSEGVFDYFKHDRTRMYLCYRYKGVVWRIEKLLFKFLFDLGRSIMDKKKIEKLYELLEKAKADKDNEAVAVLRWAIFYLENYPKQ